MDAFEVIELARARQVIPTDARRIRRAAGLSLEEVAGAVGVTAAAVSRWENGGRVPHGHAAVRYLRLLGSLAEVAA